MESGEKSDSPRILKEIEKRKEVGII